MQEQWGLQQGTGMINCCPLKSISAQQVPTSQIISGSSGLAKLLAREPGSAEEQWVLQREDLAGMEHVARHARAVHKRQTCL